MRLHPLAPVIAVDIDGTIGDYYEHFRWFAELYLQRKVEAKWEFSDSAEFSEALNISKDVYRDIKLAYRQGGMKRSLPAFSGAGRTIQDIRKLGIQIWICTTRPWQRLDNIDPDTQFWINHNIGRVDGVIYGEHKYLDLIDIVGKDRIVGVFDDLPENIIIAKSHGLNAAIRSGGHNIAFRKIHTEIPAINFSGEMFTQTNIWFKDFNNKKEL